VLILYYYHVLIVFSTFTITTSHIRAIELKIVAALKSLSYRCVEIVCVEAELRSLKGAPLPRSAVGSLHDGSAYLTSVRERRQFSMEWSGNRGVAVNGKLSCKF
jgi:hypothetical protein